jgi:hypothetical protein
VGEMLQHYMQNKRPDISLHNNKNVTLEYVIDTAVPHIENTYSPPQSPELYEMNILDSNST